MDKIKKIARWLAGNIARVIFAVMVVFLCWRVYKVIQPPEEVATPNHTLPRTALPEDPDELKALGFPGAPPEVPPAFRSENWNALSGSNPFWYYGTKATEDPSAQKAENVQIFLTRISKGKGGVLQAQLRTQSLTKWYSEGESFESFQLLRINPEQKTCEVYSEGLRKTITLTITR